MSERFFSAKPVTSDRVRLDGPEAHHLLHVMRAAVGDAVTVFDGGGAEFAAVVETLGRSKAELRIIEQCEINRELPFPLMVGVALPKGDRQKWLVEKLTELGVTALVPLSTVHGVAQPTASALERLRRSVVEAAKQCGRNRLMTVHEPASWNEFLDKHDCVAPGSSESPHTRRLLAHPSGTPFSQLDLRTTMPTQLAIGPEGGFSDGEIAAAVEAGWKLVNLGPRILRVETAAVALAAAVTLLTSAAANASAPGEKT